MKTLLIGNIHQDARTLLNQYAEVEHLSNETFSQNIEEKDHEAVVLRTYTNLRKPQLDLFPHLKYVVSCSVGIENIDLEELKRRNIELVHCPGSNANAVAEHTLHLLLSICRNQTPFFELKDKTIGIIGFGHIGKLVARKLKGFQAKVIAYDVIEQDPEVLRELNVEMKELPELLQNSDISTVHVPLMPPTRGMINDNIFSQMKSNSYFINTSRAEVIDEEALIRHQHKFKGIALDVHSSHLKENLINPFLTEHIAAQGEDSWRAMCLEPVKKLIGKTE